MSFNILINYSYKKLHMRHKIMDFLQFKIEDLSLKQAWQRISQARKDCKKSKAMQSQGWSGGRWALPSRIGWFLIKKLCTRK